MKSLRLLFIMLLGLSGSIVNAQTGECSGTWTEAAEGTFDLGFDYTIVTNGEDVTVSVELLDIKDGLVAFAQTYNPDFAEVPMDNTGGQSFSKTFPGQVDGNSFSVAIKFAFAGGLATSTIIEYTVGEGCVVVNNTECSGTWTDAAEGTFDLGFDYSIITEGDVVTVSVELLDIKDGLIAFAQTYNPDFAEVPMDNTGGQSFSKTFPGQVDGNSFNIAIKFAFAGGLATSTIIEYTVGEGCAGSNTSDISLPVTFEDEAIDYELVDFEGTTSQIIVDPTDAGNLVVETVKSETAAFFAGTTVADVSGFSEPIPFEAGATSMTVRVWSPTADTPVRLKVEQVGVPTVSVETEAMTTVSEQWETLTFNFIDQVDGTAAINLASIYNKATIFFNFGTTGADAGAQTYYWDDVAFVAPDPNIIELPITFEDSEVDYELVDFEGTTSQIIVDPTDAGNLVVETVKSETAAFFAGTTVADVSGFSEPIPFEAGATSMTVRVWSPSADTPVRLKVEQVGVPTVSVETEAMTTVSEQWETLTFDFSNQVDGTAAINFASIYDKATIFFNFGTTGADAGAQTYYWDDVAFVAPEPNIIELPVTFEDSEVDYELADFEGTTSQIIIDPTDAGNLVVETIKSETAAFFAGTTVADVTGFSEPIPFEEGSTSMTVRVWSPTANTTIRLKVEQVGVPTVSVETEAMTTVAEEWETLTFDFSNQVDGTAAINFASIYNKATIFFNFGTTGADAGSQTYYWDDVAFGSAPEPFTVVDIIVNSDDHNTLEAALVAAELIDALNGNGPFTVFAPTDEAFANLPPGILDALLADPTGDLQEVLLYHVLGMEVLEADITAGDVTTLQGEDVSISIVSGDVFVNDALVTVTDLVADNGVVHVIDAVLVPASIVIIGLDEISSNENIKVWPNPAVDNLNISFLDGNFAGTTLRIFDVAGRLIESVNVQSSMVNVQTSSFQAGNYIMRIDTPQGGFYHKFMVTK